MNKEKEQQIDIELIKNLFSKSFDQSYDHNFDKAFDEVYQAEKKIRDDNEYKKFKDTIGYNNLYIKCKNSIKNSIWGLLKGTMELYQRSGKILVKIEIKKKILLHIKRH